MWTLKALKQGTDMEKLWKNKAVVIIDSFPACFNLNCRVQIYRAICSAR